jgi:cyclomaltodextrinase
MQLILLLLLGAFLTSTVRAQATSDPSWPAHAVWYQIFPERFRNGDPTNDPTRDTLENPGKVPANWRISPWTGDWYARDDWETAQDHGPSSDDTPNFYKDGVFDRRYGGDLQGVIDKLDYLQRLGVNAIYLNPVFYAPSLHKYDGSALNHVDPYFGPDPQGDLALIATENEHPETWHWTAADRLFLKLVAEAHKRGFHVLLDGVFNHTGRGFFAFRDLKEKQQASAYAGWYEVKSWADPAKPGSRFTYRGWFGLDTLPVFAATSDRQNMAAGPKQYVFNVTKRWLAPVVDGVAAQGIDGWRLDAADERPAGFWRDWNAYVRSINPEAYTCGETWKPAAKFVVDCGFSACMNYWAFAYPVKGFLVDGRISASRFVELLNTRRDAFPEATRFVLEDLIDSHDTDRLASMIVNRELAAYSPTGDISYSENNDVRMNSPYSIAKPDAAARAIQREVVLFQMTYLGAPVIYYGDEAGMWGAHDPDERMPMVWADLKYDLQKTDPRGNPRSPDDPNFDPTVFDFYQRAIALRKNHPALGDGNIEFLGTDDKNRTFSMVRRGPSETLVEIFNRDDRPHDVHFPAPTREWDLPRVIFSTGGSLPAPSKTSDGWTIHLPERTAAVCVGTPKASP